MWYQIFSEKTSLGEIPPMKNPIEISLKIVVKGLSIKFICMRFVDPLLYGKKLYRVIV
jgi:hypothetical protein